MALIDGRFDEGYRAGTAAVEAQGRRPPAAQAEGRGRAAVAALRARLITFRRDYAGAVRLGVGNRADRIDLTISDAPVFLKKPVARLTIHPLEDGSFHIVDRRRDPRGQGVRSWCETEHLVMQQVRNVAAQVGLGSDTAPYEWPALADVLSPPVLLVLSLAAAAMSALTFVF